MVKKTSSKKLSKGKKTLIIASCVAAAEAVAGVAAAIAAPLTGGATAPIAIAMLSDSVKNASIVGGAAVVGAGVGVVVTKTVDAKKNAKSYRDGYTDASKVYESKYDKQAREFAKNASEWESTVNDLERTKEKKDALLKDCIKYIDDLEKERDSLLAENRKLSKEKQELLDQLYAIRGELSVA